MTKYLLPKGGNRYKANLHMHTTVSDGEMTPEEVKAEFSAQGYSIVAFTDHEVIIPHSELTDDTFLALTATEMEVKANLPGGFEYFKAYHLNLYSKDPARKTYSLFHEDCAWGNALEYITAEQRKFRYEREYSPQAVNRMIEIANEEGFLVSYNHPVWSLQNYEDYASLKGLWGIELHNSGSVLMGMADTQQPLRDLLQQGKQVFPLATDDAHKKAHCFQGFTQIFADKLEYDEIMGALERGDFYSSQGPTIDELYIEDGVLRMRCSPVREAVLITERRYSAAQRAEDGASLTEAAFDLQPYLEATCKESARQPYFRIVLQDAGGRQAYTRAYFLDEIDK